MIPVYVAGSSAEPERVRRAMNGLRAIPDVYLIQDWLKDVEMVGTANPTDPLQRYAYATKDLEAVRKSQIFWLLMPTQRTIGSWVELGIYLGCRQFSSLHRTIIISGPAIERSIFTSLADYTHATDEEALKLIRDCG